MKIKDLKPSQIHVGMRVKQRGKKIIGTIVEIDSERYSWVRWDGEERAYTCFRDNNCKLRVVQQ